MRWLPTLVVTVLALGAAGATPPSEAVGAPSGTEIVFTRPEKQNARSSLYVMRADGSHVRLLVRNASAATVSADGRRIAFVRDAAIWVMNRDGSQQRRVTPRGRGWAETGDPAWSHDGRTLYFYRSAEAPPPEDAWRPAIFSIRADGTLPNRVTKGSCDVSPAPSPTGRLIAYVSMGGDRELDCIEGANAYLHAVTTSGRSVALPIAFPDGWDYAPAWSPDGRRLAFVEVTESDLGFRETIYAAAFTRSKPQLLMRAPRDKHLSSPAWSPDGRQVAFGMDSDVWSTRLDGSRPWRLIHALTAIGSVAWLPPA